MLRIRYKYKFYISYVLEKYMKIYEYNYNTKARLTLLHYYSQISFPTTKFSAFLVIDWGKLGTTFPRMPFSTWLQVTVDE